MAAAIANTFASLSQIVNVEALPTFDPTKQIHEVEKRTHRNRRSTHQVAPAQAVTVVEPKEPAAAPVEEIVPDGMVTIADARKHVHGLTTARDQRLGVYVDGRPRYEALVSFLQSNPKLVTELGQDLLDNHTLFTLINHDVKAGRLSKRKQFVPLEKMTEMSQVVNATEHAFYTLQVEILTKRAEQLQRTYAFVRETMTGEEMHVVACLISAAGRALNLFRATMRAKRPLTATSKAYLAAEEAFKALAYALPWPEKNDFSAKKPIL